MFKKVFLKREWLFKLLFFYATIKLIICLLSSVVKLPYFNTLNIENYVVSDISFNDLYYRVRPAESLPLLSGKVILVNAATLSSDTSQFRREMADLIVRLQECKPAVIGVDYQFNKNGDTSATAQLKQVVQHTDNIIMASCKEKDNCEKFSAEDSDVSFPEDQITIRRYSTQKNTFAYKIAQRLQPNISDKFLKKNSFLIHYLTDYTISYRDSAWTPDMSEIILSQAFFVIDGKSFLSDSLERADIQNVLKDKALLIGNMGPFSNHTMNKYYTEDKKRVPFDTTNLFNRDRTMDGVLIHANVIENLLNHENRFHTWSDETWFIILDEIMLILFLAFLLFVKAGKLINVILLLFITFPLILLVLYLMLNHLVYIQIGLSLLQFLIFEEMTDVLEPFYERTKKLFKSFV